MSERFDYSPRTFEACTDTEKLDRAKQYWEKNLTGEARITEQLHPDCVCAIVVPVYNEDVRRLKKQLDSIAKQTVTHDAFEVIYVVNNDQPQSGRVTPEVLENNRAVIEFLQSYDTVRVHVIDKSTSGKEIADCNVGRARNRGVAEASLRFFEQGKNGIIIQTDADTYFEEAQYLENVLAKFQSDTSAIGIAGGLIYEFDPDVAGVEDRDLMSAKMERLLQMKIWDTLKDFLAGELDLRTKDTNFSGAHMLSRSFETAVVGGLHDIPSGEDPQFGKDLMDYGAHNNGVVIGMKDSLKVVTALRDSDRTPASFKKIIDGIDPAKPLIMDGEVVTDERIEELEMEVLRHEDGRALIEYMRKNLNSLRLKPLEE